MEIIKTNAKEIFTKTKLPGADWVINQYVGCGHGCRYCYARFMSRWKGYGDWGTWVEAKINSPELVKGRYLSGHVFMSSVSDAYQPVEKELKLTRSILEHMDKNIKLSILTKSNLILRDIEILKRFKEVEIGFTINSLVDKDKEIFEPNSVSNDQRIEALRNLKDEGFKVYVFVSPIIPDLTNVKSVIEKTKDYADYYWFEFLNLRGAGKDFQKLLNEEYPESYKVVSNKEIYDQYIKEIKKEIGGIKINVKGIELH